MTTAAATFPAAVPARPATNKWLVTISVTFGTLMGAIDASIVNVALPHMRGAVGATLQEITWVTTGFAIATVIVMPLTAFLGRLFGQKRVYMASLILFVVASALCGVASTLTQLVLFRVLQGFGAGALQPTEQAILRQTFPPEEQGTAMALFGMAVMVGPAVGPPGNCWTANPGLPAPGTASISGGDPMRTIVFSTLLAAGAALAVIGALLLLARLLEQLVE